MKNIKTRVTVIFLSLIMVMSAISVPAIESYAADGSTVVYITKTGECYHKGTCSSLKKSKIETTMQDAVNSGLRPCKKCKPGTVTTATTTAATAPAGGAANSVYISTSSVSYHKKNNCSGITNPIATSETEAQKFGFTKCKNCFK